MRDIIMSFTSGALIYRMQCFDGEKENHESKAIKLGSDENCHTALLAMKLLSSDLLQLSMY